MRTTFVLLLLWGFVQVLIAADHSVRAMLRVAEECDASDHVTLLITAPTGKAGANPDGVRIPGGLGNFKPMDEKLHLFLLSADGRTFGCIEKDAVQAYRCDAVVLNKQGTLQLYPDLNEKIRPYLKAKHLPVDAEELFIESVEPRQVILGGAIVRNKEQIRDLFVQVALRANGEVEVVKSWFEKGE